MVSLGVSFYAEQDTAFRLFRLDVKYLEDEGFFVFRQCSGNCGAQETAPLAEVPWHLLGAVQFVGKVFIFFTEGGTCLFIESCGLAFTDAGPYFPFLFFIEHELAFHMPDDEGKTQDDENNDFSGMAVFYRRAADDGNDDDQNGLEYVRFFEERVIGFFGHGDMQERENSGGHSAQNTF